MSCFTQNKIICRFQYVGGSKLSNMFKVLCYLQSGKIWVVLQNLYIFCKKLSLAQDCRLSKYSLWKFKRYILLILSVAFWFLRHSKNLSQIFKLLFHAGKINTFHLHGFLFSRSVQLKRTFSDVVVLFFIMWNCTDNANRDVLLTVENMYDIFSSIAICGCLKCLFSSSGSFGFWETFD